MNDCNVCLHFDGDYAEHFTSRNMAGRKAHKCCECNRVMPKGEIHEFVKMLSEGEWMTFRTCLICAEIRAAFCCEGVMYGSDFWEQMADYSFAEMTTGCLDRLKTPEAKAYLIQRWNEWKFNCA